MNRYATIKDFEKMSVAQLESTIDDYLEIILDSDYITPQFENELRGLMALAKLKGSVRKW